ncbi:MAG: hypothetical protein HQK79_21940 [Desulfobacterales bacterium]|nr:hypothetical protein [Desulfobacterales bacterium]
MILTLKPQDIVVILKLFSIKPKWSYSTLAYELFMSASEVHACINRSILARLVDPSDKKPLKKAVQEFLIHGIKYVYPAEIGSIIRGMPTSYGTLPLSNFIINNGLPPVWPDSEAQTHGYELKPLYKTVPKAANRDQRLYQMLSLVDAIRHGSAREQKIAIEQFNILLK